MQKTVKVGMMPGRINEFVVEVGTSIKDLLLVAELDATGYEIKVDGATITTTEAVVVNESTNLVLLVKQVKGNAPKTVKVGMMPGRINEFVVEEGVTIASVIATAELDATGYEVKVDGETITNYEMAKVTTSTSLILLVKQVKGNR